MAMPQQAGCHLLTSRVNKTLTISAAPLIWLTSKVEQAYKNTNFAKASKSPYSSKIKPIFAVFSQNMTYN
jgi:hypothetical protein